MHREKGWLLLALVQPPTDLCGDAEAGEGLELEGGVGGRRGHARPDLTTHHTTRHKPRSEPHNKARPPVPSIPPHQQTEQASQHTIARPIQLEAGPRSPEAEGVTRGLLTSMASCGLCGRAKP
jgi:hypothetical protein